MPRFLLLLLALSLCVACRQDKKILHTGQSIALTDTALYIGGLDTVHFGHLQPGEIAVKQLLFENCTARNIILTDYTTSCGCVSLEFDKQPIAPNGSAPARITFDSQGLYGWQFKSLCVHFSPGGVAGQRIYLEAEVE